MIAMPTNDEVQSAVTRNVQVLAAVRQVGDQKALAALLDWEAPKLSKTFRGHRRWALEDIVVIADRFGIEPGALLGPVDKLIGAVEGRSVAVGSGSLRAEPTDTYPRLAGSGTAEPTPSYLPGAARRAPRRRPLGPFGSTSVRPILALVPDYAA